MSKSPGVGEDGSTGVKIVIPFHFSVKQSANLICSQECLHKIKNSSALMAMSRRHIRTDKRLKPDQFKNASNDASMVVRLLFSFKK